MLVKALNIQCAHKQFQTPVLVWYCKKKEKKVCHQNLHSNNVLGCCLLI